MKFAALVIAALAASGTVALGQTPNLVTEDMMVAAQDPGIQIFVRNKRPADMNAFLPERTLVFVHGATYPAHTAFDLKLGGFSWMDYIASRGYDVYLLDLRGYGKSTRPKEMDEDPKANPPIVRGDTAVKDIGSVVDFVLRRRNIPRVNLMGWSWGTVLMATYATQNPEKVERLVLYAPGWIRTTPSLVQAGPGPTPAYRTVAKDQAKTRWLTGVADDKKADLIPTGWFETWADATWGDRSEVVRKQPAALARAERRSAGRRRLLVGRQGLLRSCQGDGARLAGGRRMGPRYAALHGADAVPAADEFARQAVGAAGRGHPYHRDGEEPTQAVRGGAGFPRRGRPVVIIRRVRKSVAIAARAHAPLRTLRGGLHCPREFGELAVEARRVLEERRVPDTLVDR